MKYQIVFSDRKTVGLSVKDGKLTVRAPRGTKVDFIEKVVEKHRGWIEKHMNVSAIKNDRYNLNEENIRVLKSEARVYFKDCVERFSFVMGLFPRRVRITSAKRRFGSCSSEGNLCFSYLLMLYPEKAREYVVVHELAHLVHMNHSPLFYELVAKYLPDYKERIRMLKL